MQARETARELLKRADAIVQLATSLDDANSVRVEASRALRDELTQIRELARGLGVFVPSDEQLFALGSRADQTSTMLTPWAREMGEHLPPLSGATTCPMQVSGTPALVQGAKVSPR